MVPYQLSLPRAQTQLKGERTYFGFWFREFGCARRERYGGRTLGQLVSPTASSHGGKIDAGAQLAFSFLHRQDPSPQPGATRMCAHTWVFPLQANLENPSQIYQ